MSNDRSRLPIKGGCLHRPRIDAMLQKGLEHTLVTVVAGPGYGKTLSVAEFVKPLRGRLVWLHLNSFDNDLQCFWNNFILALSEELPELQEPLNTIGYPDSPAKYDTFLRLFSHEIYMGEQVTMVVDDFALLHECDAHSFFENLIRSGLENFCLVIISSVKNNINIGGIYSNGGVYSITMEDLAFNESEVREFFESYGNTLSDRELRQVMSLTGGWPLALYYLNLKYSHNKTISDAVMTPMALAAELFQSECFGGYPPAIQQLLIKLSVLSRFSLEVIKKLWQGDLASAMNTIAENMYIAYDPTARVFTMQNMYRDFLAQRQNILSAEEFSHVCLVAGDWLFENGQYFEAIDLYRECRNFERMLQSMNHLAATKLSREMAEYILECIGLFDAEFIAAHPEIECHHACVYLNNMDTHKALAIYTRVRERLESLPDLPLKWRGLLGEIYIKLADISLYHNNDLFLSYYRKAHGLLPEGSIRHDRNLLYVGNNNMFFLPDGQPGRLEYMLSALPEVAPSVDAVLRGSGYGFELYYAMEAYYNIGNFGKAREYGYQAIEKARRMDQHDIICNVYFLFMQLAFLQGDLNRAVESLEAITSYINDRRLIMLYELRDCVASWFHIRVRDLGKVSGWIVESDPEHYENPPINVGRSYILSAHYWMVQREYYRALGVLRQIEDVFVQRGLWRLRLLTHIMRAECYRRCNEPDQALEEFQAAYDMSYANHIVTPFVEFGNVMRTLVDMARKSGRAFDPEWLDCVYQKSSASAKRLVTIINAYNRANKVKPINAVALNRRDIEILRGLADGHTREEIASSIDLSVNGVKKNIARIYGKLGAINRSDAIRIATQMGHIR